jgi:hypothetical protein
MMRILLLHFFVCIGFAAHVQAQSDFQLHLSLPLGASMLSHDTRFETTPLHNLYKFVAISQREYTWEDFERDYKIRSTFLQARYGLRAELGYRDWPLFVTGDVTSSTSSYQKLSFNVSAGFGKDFHVMDSVCFLSLRGGYKFVIRDNGFGAKTLINSIGNDEARSLAFTFFDPKQPLGRPSGNLLMLRLGGGFYLDAQKKISLGAEAYGELDLTDRTIRESRMNAVGANVYLRVQLLGAAPKYDPYAKVLEQMRRK